MNVKIDTKEKFSVITLFDAHLAANMTEDLRSTLVDFIEKPVPHIVVNLTNVTEIEPGPAEVLAATQQTFYENNISFVICELKEQPEATLDEMGLLEFMNVTPTESEAWDIVQMEEIERELMSDMDDAAQTS